MKIPLVANCEDQYQTPPFTPASDLGLHYFQRRIYATTAAKGLNGDTFTHTGMKIHTLIGDIFTHTGMNCYALIGESFTHTGMIFHALIGDTFKHTGMNMYALIGDTFKHTCMNIYALIGDVFKHTGMNIYTLTLSAPNLILSVVTGFGSNILTK